MKSLSQAEVRKICFYAIVINFVAIILGFDFLFTWMLLIVLVTTSVALSVYGFSSTYWLAQQARKECPMLNNVAAQIIPPRRRAFARMYQRMLTTKRCMFEFVLTGFNYFSGKPGWLSDRQLAEGYLILSPTKDNKVELINSLILQELLKFRKQSLVVIDDSESDSVQFDNIVKIAKICGRKNDLKIISADKRSSGYNFTAGDKSASLRAQKILDLFPILVPNSANKLGEYAVIQDYIFRLVKILDSTKENWTLDCLMGLIQNPLEELEVLRTQVGLSLNSEELAEFTYLDSFLKRRNVDAEIKRPLELLSRITKEVKQQFTSSVVNFVAQRNTALSLEQLLQRGQIIYFRFGPELTAEEKSTIKRVILSDLVYCAKEQLGGVNLYSANSEIDTLSCLKMAEFRSIYQHYSIIIGVEKAVRTTQGKQLQLDENWVDNFSNIILLSADPFALEHYFGQGFASEDLLANENVELLYPIAQKVADSPLAEQLHLAWIKVANRNWQPFRPTLLKIH